MHKQITRADRFTHWLADLGRTIRDYFGAIVRRRHEPLNDRAALKRFLETRASFVTQTSLYGYLRTRAGMIYPQLFDNDEYVESINVAKWYLWLACLSDLALYTGGLLAQRAARPASEVGAFMEKLVAAILDDTGVPADAGGEFAAQAQRVRARLAQHDWERFDDDETCFSESPTALVRWAPVVENLKELDEEIVRNSVRFRWQEIRRELRAHLDAEAVLQS